MFQWDKSIKSMDVPAEEVVHLYRSMRDVQLALPGLHAQEATAYLCQHKTPQGIGTVAAFHFHKSKLLAFYVDSPMVVAVDKADSVLDQALTFVESMGFLIADLDIHLLGESDRELLWSSLPLQNGIQDADKSQPSTPVASLQTKVAVPATLAVPGVKVSAATAVLPEEKQSPVSSAADEMQQESLSAETAVNGQANVDDLLAAVEELRTRRPGVRSRKKPPGPDELKRRRQELRENIGRVLASL